MEILIVREPIDEKAAQELAQAWHADLLKGVADIRRGVLALGGEWHIDANNVLLADGSAQQDVWGFNVYPAQRGNEAIEYISLINVRPAQGNRSMTVVDESIRMSINMLVQRYMLFLNV